MYRSRLKGKLDGHTLEFLSSISDDFEIALYDILGSQAHTLMLLENKIITRAEAIKILQLLNDSKRKTYPKNLMQKIFMS